MSFPATTSRLQRTLPSYRTVWRWHFYAGLFCIPFVVWLSVTGSIYLFRPQIEEWLDHPYDELPMTGPPAPRAAQVEAAIKAVPFSNLHFYQLPRSPRSASQIIVGRNTNEYRVYIHPRTLRVLQVVNEARRPMTVVFHLHGELLIGDWGSRIVELAASWAIIMLLTGIVLWWPRGARHFGGILYPRLKSGKRICWRDLHAVTGIWVSGLALFLLFTGLPWASSWGKYLEMVRSLTNTTGNPDWTMGSSSEVAARAARNPVGAAEPIRHADHAMTSDLSRPSISYAPLDTIVARIAPLNLAYPVLVSPPVELGQLWTAKSDAQNRTLRVNLALDPATGRIVKRENFNQLQWIDRVVETGVAAHEGQLFGFPNQLLGVFTAASLILMSISSIVLWWRRRPEKVLGAPLPEPQQKLAPFFVVAVIAFGIYLPMLGVSLAAVWLVERLLLRRLPGVRNWLGLSMTERKEWRSA